MDIKKIDENLSLPIIPSSWGWIAIGEISKKIHYGYTARAIKNLVGPKLLRITDIQNNTVNWETVPYCEIEDNEIQKYRLSQGDLVIARTGATVGKSFLIKSNIPDAIFASYLIRIIVDKYIDAQFVYYFFQSYFYWSQIYPNIIGIAQPSVNAQTLSKIKLPLPPLNEQHRIVAKLEQLLSRVQSCQERMDRIPKILKRFRQSILAAACSGRLTEDFRHSYGSKYIEGFGDIPEVWQYAPLKECCTKFQYGTSKKSIKLGTIPVLRMGNLQDGKIDWQDLVYTSDPDEIEKYKLELGDVLFNRTNSPELVGKTSIYQGERPAIFAGYLIRIKTVQQLHPEYLNYCLNSIYAKEYCLQVQTYGVSQSNINAQKLSLFSIPLPPLAEQHEIVRRVESLFSLSDQVEERYNKAKACVGHLTQSILAKAFRGELVPQDLNDEPAEVLLERIRQEKASQGKAAGKSRTKRTKNRP